MSIDFKAIEDKHRVLIKVALKPVAGTRIQPTGFPDLGAAIYERPPETEQEERDYPKGIPTLLVESAQSMANRLEAVCWDDANDDLVPELKGLPHVRVKLAGLGNGSDTTSSLLEFHRLNSPYIMSGKDKDGTAFADVLKPQLGMVAVAGPARRTTGRRATTAESKTEESTDSGEKERDDVAGVVNLRKLAAICFKYDPNSLVHGVFLEKIAGRLRHPRALSAFIEASGVGRADSGGVKFDRALPKPSLAGVDAKTGYGNVPFHRTEFTAKVIAAFFSLDLAQIRGYGLGDDAWKLLVAFSLWKVRRFLDSNMRLRTACELELTESEISCCYKDADRKDQKFALPLDSELTKQLAELLKKCNHQFAAPLVTELTWNNPRA